MTSLGAVAILQFLLAATFVIIPIVGARHGPRAHRAVEADVRSQGFPAVAIAEHRIDFTASRASIMIACGIGLVLAALAVLNLAGNGAGVGRFGGARWGRGRLTLCC